MDESALKSWIRSGGTAVVDVWENEPDIDPDLCALAALATPHIAGYSVQAKFRATRMCVDALRRTLDAGRWTPDVGRRTLDVADRQPPTAAVLRDLSDALKASPTAETFNSLRNESPLRVEAE